MHSFNLSTILMVMRGWSMILHAASPHAAHQKDMYNPHNDPVSLTDPQYTPNVLQNKMLFFLLLSRRLSI